MNIVVSAIFKKNVFFSKVGLVEFQGGSREGSETCVGRPCGLKGGHRERGSGPRGPFLEDPGSAKVRQGSNFDVFPWLVLTFSFFALNDFWEVPRGSWERVQRQRRCPGGAQES